MKKKTHQDLDFISETNLDAMQGPKRVSHIILWSALAFIISAILWANWAVIDEVTTGEGTVIPSKQVQVIQNLEGGIVKSMDVKEGQVVQKGQVLMQIDDTRFSASYKENVSKLASLRIKLLRLDAETENKKFVIPDDLMHKHRDTASNERDTYRSRQNKLKQLKSSIKYANEELTMTKPLVKKGAASRVEVLRLQRQISDLEGQLYDFQNQALDELNKTKSELSALSESHLADKDRLTRTTVRSPVKGIIKQININTIGGVVQPGMDLMEIVPLDDTLLIEAKIKPKDIGFIHPGQKATVNLTAYDFSVYGSLEGKVERISADAITEEKSEDTYYLVQVRTSKNYLGSEADPLRIIPGMVATVDVLTGKKTVLNYILNPLISASKKALREK